jgi:hypothetical protein
MKQTYCIEVCRFVSGILYLSVVSIWLAFFIVISLIDDHLNVK